MIHENVPESTEATQQQHLVPRWAHVYIQWLSGGPVGVHVLTAADKEGLEGRSVTVTNSLTTHNCSRPLLRPASEGDICVCVQHHK